MQTIVYVDGFNLYYGALKGTAHKWSNIKVIRQELKLAVGILNPSRFNQSFELQRNASFVKPIRSGVLSASQFPPVMNDSTGTFTQPTSW